MTTDCEGLFEGDPQSLSPLVLAYIGDAVFELWVRGHLVQSGGRRMCSLHQQAVGLVNAGSQADILKTWAPHLNEAEMNIVKRGRNTKSGVPRGAKVSDYRLSTGLEALVGYLYLAGEKGRLAQLFSLAFKARQDMDNLVEKEQ
ncbi:MAG: Mini-ribonuclease 3 [Firmicutes bacterium]|nr:Mini-ribonuclease 3 [Bacillota bacterium]